MSASKNKLLAVGLAECLLVLPAAFALSIAALRLMQPRQYEPARTAWVIFEWMGVHLTRTDAAFMFLVFPAMAFAVGGGILLRKWSTDELFRLDVVAFLVVLQRNIQTLILAAATLAGAAILAAAVVHVITD